MKKTYQVSLAEFEIKKQSEITTLKAFHKDELEKLENKLKNEVCRLKLEFDRLA